MRHKVARTYVIAVSLECPYCHETRCNSADGSLMWETDHFPESRSDFFPMECKDCGKTFKVKRPRSL